MSGSEELLWIVFAGDRPTTAHLSEDEAREAARLALDRDASGAVYSIWSARLTHSADPGIPIYRTEQGPTETFETTGRAAWWNRCVTCGQFFDPADDKQAAYHDQEGDHTPMR